MTSPTDNPTGGFVLGLSGVSYYNTGTYGSPVWVVIDQVGDVEIPLEFDEADATTPPAAASSRSCRRSPRARSRSTRNTTRPTRRGPPCRRPAIRGADGVPVPRRTGDQHRPTRLPALLLHHQIWPHSEAERDHGQPAHASPRPEPTRPPGTPWHRQRQRSEGKKKLFDAPVSTSQIERTRHDGTHE